MQEFIEWSDTLSVGVKEIDDQHKKLIDMLNELNKAIQSGWGKKREKKLSANSLSIREYISPLKKAL